MDYSQDVGLVHQCGLLVDLRDGNLIFYEPYLTFVKYGLDYAQTMKQYLEIYAGALPPKFIDGAGAIKYHTFRDFFGIEKGIQTIILEKNNANEQAFDEALRGLLRDVDAELPDLANIISKDIAGDTNPVNAVDKTIRILNVLECFVWHPNKNAQYEALLTRALELYHTYNSKTCVSITLTEISNLFSIYSAREAEDHAYVLAQIKEYYSGYAGDTPNKLLMERIQALIKDVFSDEIYKKINDLDIEGVCAAID
jgi:hypothetical protein